MTRLEPDRGALERVAVLWQGVLQQVGTPEELHERPLNRVVASFVGRANLLPGRLERNGEGWQVALAAGPRSLPSPGSRPTPAWCSRWRRWVRYAGGWRSPTW